jgi:hypothetical protein
MRDTDQMKIDVHIDSEIDPLRGIPFDPFLLSPALAVPFFC